MKKVDNTVKNRKEEKRINIVISNKLHVNDTFIQLEIVRNEITMPQIYIFDKIIILKLLIIITLKITNCRLYNKAVNNKE